MDCTGNMIAAYLWIQIMKNYYSKLFLHHGISFDSLIKLFKVPMGKCRHALLCFILMKGSTGVSLNNVPIVAFFDIQRTGITPLYWIFLKTLNACSAPAKYII